MPIRFIALETETVRHLQNGGADAYGNKPERQISDCGAIPCRHCLQPVSRGEPYLVVAYSPFDERQPYAETGPIFLHEAKCRRAGDSDAPAPMFSFGKGYILRGYGENDRINYDAAGVVKPAEITAFAEALLSRDDVAYVHMRSSHFNCYQCRIERT